MGRNCRTVCRHYWPTNWKVFWSPHWHSLLIKLTIQPIFEISFQGITKSFKELYFATQNNRQTLAIPFLWSSLSKPSLHIMSHLSGDLEHDHVENGCNGKSSLLHTGTCLRVRFGLWPLVKRENKNNLKIIFS